MGNDATIFDVREAIANATGRPISSFRLGFGGTVLDNGPMSDQGVGTDAEVYIVPSLQSMYPLVMVDLCMHPSL